MDHRQHLLGPSTILIGSETSWEKGKRPCLWRVPVKFTDPVAKQTCQIASYSFYSHKRPHKHFGVSLKRFLVVASLSLRQTRTLYPTLMLHPGGKGALMLGLRKVKVPWSLSFLCHLSCAQDSNPAGPYALQ